MIVEDISASGKADNELALFVDGNHVDVPDAATMFRGDYAKDGQDLTISLEGGDTLRVLDYFSFGFPPDLVAPDGAQLRGDVVTRLAGAGDDTRLAQAGDGASTVSAQDLENAIGQVETLEGTVTVTRADGTVVTLGIGDLVFSNDLVSTGQSASISLTFVDGTIFSLSAGSRMLLDELIYDPGGDDNSAVFNLIEGSFVFIAGQVAPTGDMRVETPTGVLGIRGTTVEVQIIANDGVTEVLISLLLDSDGSLGEVQVFDLNGNLVTVITETDFSWLLSSVDGETRQIPRAVAEQTADETLVVAARAAEAAANGRFSTEGTYLDPDAVSGGGGPEEDEQDTDDTPAPEDVPPSGGGGQGIETEEDGALDETTPEPDQTPDQNDPASDGQITPDIQEQDEGSLQDAEEVTETAGLTPQQEDTQVTELTEGGAIQRQQNDETAVSVGNDLQNTPSVAMLPDGTIALTETPEGIQSAQVPQAQDTAGFEPAAAGLEGPAPLALATFAFAETGDLNVDDVGGTEFGTLGDAQDVSQFGNDPLALPTFASAPLTQSTLGAPPETTSETDLAATPSLAAPDREANDPVINEPPEALGGGVTLFADQEGRTGQLPGADPEEGELIFQILTQPENGTVRLLDDQTGLFEFTPDPGFTGTDTFSYQVTDATGNTSEAADFTVNFNPTNLDPVPGTQSISVSEDGATIINLLEGASDPEDGVLTIVGVGEPQNGTATLSAGGSVQYRPNANFNGTDSFTYTLADDAGGTTIATATVAVIAVNDPPVVTDENGTVAEDGAVVITVLDGDDFDPDGDTLTLQSVSDPSNGTAEVGANGTVIYTPDADFSGTDSFTYRVSDGQGGTQDGTVIVTVTPQNDAPNASDDTAQTREDQPVSFNLADNDTDIDGDALTVVSVSGAASGEVVLLNNLGDVTYTPDPDFSGQDSFTYVLSDGELQVTGNVSVSVGAVNDPPVAADDTAVTEEDTAITFAVLPNDADAEGAALTILNVSQPANGAVAIEADGTLTYSPDADFFGADSFTYTVSDGAGGRTDIGSVQVTVVSVNDAPVVEDDNATTAEETLVRINVLDNDSDPEAGTLTITSVSDPANGSVQVNADGTISYTPNALFNGQDSFTYTISDPDGGTASGVVVVSVASVNAPPVAVGDLVTVTEDSNNFISVIANDTDADGDTLTLDSVGQPANGTAVLTTGNRVIYTPDLNFNGDDSFTYVVTDGFGGFDTGTVNVTVTPEPDNPTAVEDFATTTQATLINIDAVANDFDVDGETVTLQAVSIAANGTVGIADDGVTIDYTPDAGFVGQDSFSYTIADTAGFAAIGTVNVTVVDTNDDPVAVQDDVSTNEDTQANISVLNNDTDADDDPLTLVSFTDPANGSVQSETDGSLTYTPDDDFFGTDTFTYVVRDPSGATATGTVIIDVIAQNDAPIAQQDGASTTESQDITFNLTDNDTDVDGDPLSLVRVDQPANGSVILGTNGDVTYTPDAGFSGQDSFTYFVSDGDIEVSGTAIVTVGFVNAAPEAEDDFATTDEGVSVEIAVLANDTDRENDDLTIEGFSQGNNGLVELGSAGTVDYTPDPGFSGVDTFTYTVVDTFGNATVGNVTVTVTDVALVANDDAETILEDSGAVAIDVLSNDTGPQGLARSVTAVSPAVNGTVTIAANGALLYTPDANFNGTEVLTYTLSDGASPDDQGQVTISVTPQADAVVIDPISGDGRLDVQDQINPVVISGVAEVNGTVDVTFGSVTLQGLTNASGNFSVSFESTDIRDGTSTTVQVDAFDANGNAGGTATQTVTIDQPGALLTITAAGSVSNFESPAFPVELDISDLPYAAYFTADSGGQIVERTPTISNDIEIRYVADDGRSFSILGTGLNLGTGAGIVDGYRLGTPTDPGFYAADGLQTPLQEVLDIFAASVSNNTIVTDPLDNFFAGYAVDFTALGGTAQLSFEEFGATGNVFRGGAENDEFRAGAGNDQYFGGAGVDFFQDSQGANLFNGGADFDIVSYQNAQGQIVVDLTAGQATKSDGQVDTLVSIEQVRGSNFADRITLLDGQDNGSVAQPLAGNDTVIGGGEGTFNFVDYSRESRFTTRTTGVVVNLATGLATDLFGDQDELTNIQGVTGTEFGDVLTGLDVGNSFLNGGAGDDRLISGNGSDTFILNDGGNDTVVFTSGQDNVVGFDFANDTLEFSGAALTFINSVQAFDATAGQEQRVFFRFDDDQGQQFGIIVSDLTLAEADQILDGLGLGGGDIIVNNDANEFAGTPGDDNFLIQPGLPPEENGSFDRSFEASSGDDTYDFTQNSFGVYNQIDYSGLTSGPIVADINLDETNSSVQKGVESTDTLLAVQSTADWGFGIVGTPDNDTFNVTFGQNPFSFVLIDGVDGQDTVNATGGGNGILRLDATGDPGA